MRTRKNMTVNAQGSEQLLSWPGCQRLCLVSRARTENDAWRSPTHSHQRITNRYRNTGDALKWNRCTCATRRPVRSTQRQALSVLNISDVTAREAAPRAECAARALGLPFVQRLPPPSCGSVSRRAVASSADSSWLHGRRIETLEEP